MTFHTAKTMDNQKRITLREPRGLNFKRAAHRLEMNVTQMVIAAVSEYCAKRGVEIQ